MKAIHSLKPAEREEAQLLETIDLKRLPRHIAIIMDGNGRWAERRHLPRLAGHRAGVDSTRNVINACRDLGVECLTIYAFSRENWRRPQTETTFLMRLLRKYLKIEMPTLHKNNVRFMAIGRIRELPEAVQKDIHDSMRMTEHNTGMRLAVALNYGGRAELADAFNAVLAKARSSGGEGLRFDEQAISDHLYTAGLPDPDLLIRTSGEMRVSNFLLWQIAYAEIYVTETLWPDFKRASLFEALIEYQRRDRRYGGLGSRGSRNGASADPSGESSR